MIFQSWFFFFYSFFFFTPHFFLFLLVPSQPSHIMNMSMDDIAEENSKSQVGMFEIWEMHGMGEVEDAAYRRQLRGGLVA